MLDPEIAEGCAWLLPYLDAFAMMVHPRYGFFAHYPLPGGWYSQPFREMQVYSIILSEYREVLKENATRGV